MIKFQVKLSGDIAKKLEARSEEALRAATYTVWFLMRKRIFNDGLKASGSPIGSYSASYLKRRQKPPYNRTSDDKKILVLTDSLRLNFVFDAISKTSYAIGVNGALNRLKVEWNDPTNEIFIISQTEARLGQEAFEKEMNS